MTTRTETLPGGTLLYTTAAAPITTDSLLLAGFCQIKPGWSACDLCCGNGILLLSLLDRGLVGNAVGVELNEDAADLLCRAIEDNGFENARCHRGNLKTFEAPHAFDLVVANPPYFLQGKQAEEEQRALARHQIGCTLDDVCRRAAAILKDRGRFCLCWPAGDSSALFSTLGRHSLAPKRMQLVRKTPQSSARLVLMDARKNGGAGLQILPDMLLPPGESLHY